jgi:hypothetical protein
MINLGASVAIGTVAGAFTGGAGAAATMAAGSLSSRVSDASALASSLKLAQAGKTQTTFTPYTAAEFKAQNLAKSGGMLGATARGAGMGALETGITGGIRDTASSLITNENYQQHTFYQFQHRYLYGGPYPISLRVKFNQTLFNQFIQKRQIKGKMAYDYFNTQTFGDYLNEPGYLKASIISWNYNLPFGNWFRERIENGVYLGSDLYEKQISETKTIQSRGKMYMSLLDEQEKAIEWSDLETERNRLKHLLTY